MEDAHAAPSAAPADRRSNANSYSLYTKRLVVDDAGVVPIPAGYVWSVESSWSGIDLQGRNLPDSRVMLRLHNPAQGFSAVTAQMDLETAATLHHQLGEMIIQKLRNPDYQDRAHVGPGREGVPVKRVIGVDANGSAILEDVDEFNSGDR